VATPIANRSMCPRHGAGEGGDTRKAFRGQSISAADALTVSLHNPIEFKLPFALGTRAQIRTLIAQRFSVKRSLVYVGRLLAQLGQSCQRPLFRAYQQDRSLVDRWMKDEFPEMRARAKREKAEIFFGDKSGVRSDFHSGTTWATKGKTPVVRVIGQRSSLKKHDPWRAIFWVPVPGMTNELAGSRVYCGSVCSQLITALSNAIR
jgi:hypothetical protein